MKNKGMTLIEILMVAIIIGLLASILTPAIFRARENARRSKCMNNLRIIGTALQMYASDHTESFPEDAEGVGGEVLGLLYPEYIDTAKAFACPSDISLQTNLPSIGADGLVDNSSYAYYEGRKATERSQKSIACDRGVSTGVIDASAPHYPTGVNVLVLGGNVIWVKAADDGGTLPTQVEGETADWSTLID